MSYPKVFVTNFPTLDITAQLQEIIDLLKTPRPQSVVIDNFSDLIVATYNTPFVCTSRIDPLFNNVNVANRVPVVLDGVIQAPGEYISVRVQPLDEIPVRVQGINSSVILPITANTPLAVNINNNPLLVRPVAGSGIYPGNLSGNFNGTSCTLAQERPGALTTELTFVQSHFEDGNFEIVPLNHDVTGESPSHTQTRTHPTTDNNVSYCPQQ
jgi:hypothetical protein